MWLFPSPEFVWKLVMIWMSVPWLSTQHSSQSARFRYWLHHPPCLINSKFLNVILYNLSIAFDTIYCFSLKHCFPFPFSTWLLTNWQLFCVLHGCLLIFLTSKCWDAPEVCLWLPFLSILTSLVTSVIFMVFIWHRFPSWTPNSFDQLKVQKWVHDPHTLSCNKPLLPTMCLNSSDVRYISSPFFSLMTTFNPSKFFTFSSDIYRI